MRISAVFPYEKVKNQILLSYHLIISFIAIFLGLIAGVTFYFLFNDSLESSLLDYFISFATEFSYKNKPEIFSGLLINNLIYFIITFIFGTSCFGTPIILLTSFIKSAGLTFIISHIYAIYALKGLEYCLIIFLPGKVILMLSMLLLTQSCCQMSSRVALNIKGTNERSPSIKTYTTRSLVILIVIIISSIVDCMTVTSFSRLFIF